MVLPKSKNSVGLGNSLMNDRFGKNKSSNMHRGNAIHRTNQLGEKYVTNEKQEAAWVKMRSVTEQGALDEFLNTAELAGTDFTAEKMNNVKIVHVDQKNPYLLSAAEERATKKRHKDNHNRLTVPRRPHWDDKTTPQELDDRERTSLLEWRRGLAELQEINDLLLTPFERNIEVWRQLWRVIERSDLVVQIVDARNPLMFRSDDLDKYVKEVDARKNNLLLVNKADMMTLEQRQAWADYFENEGINYTFFSAELAKEMNEARAAAEESDDSEGSYEDEDEVEVPKKLEPQEETEPRDSEDNRTRILTTDELEALFLERAPKIQLKEGEAPRKTSIGLVGYPNVGKSSTINALIGAKKVSVSATPGKTKHFQTIHLSEEVILCDCPGLVFPNFATTKAELVCNGVLPIDQLREFTGPAGIVASRIPKRFLEAVYGMKIKIRAQEEGGLGVPTGSEVLRAYATARGFATQGMGSPDESRAARYILKDYVKGKLLFCTPPPADPEIDALHFNRELYDDAHLPARRRGHLAEMESVADSDVNSVAMDADEISLQDAPLRGQKTASIDRTFFGRQGNAGHLRMPFSYQYSEQGKKQLTGRKQRTMVALENDIDPADLRRNGKKHFKGGARRPKGAGKPTPLDD
ncbi:P-loop containing nucleoside triphosphate hydrolase protein [Microthyrium microscopicum]|uniref:P-loop containing nucleoside triphosphate hydrolase protein n=1 Tax=Microthyrium microscopicum TaxID=703497 RepID=A0A6A6U496_9PEZI|nr:P-loop containing nucleoside triphosphate hydrolase protein [Microthyrium microscopicum]